MALRNDQLLRDLPGAAAEGGGVVRFDATWVKTASGRRVVELRLSKPLESLEHEEAVKAEAESDWWAVTCRITIPEHPNKSVDISMSEDNSVAALKTRLLALYPELSKDDSLVDVDFDEQLERAMKPQKQTGTPTKSQGGKPAPFVLQKPRDKAQEELPQTTRVREKQETFGISNVIHAVRDIVAPMLESDEDEEVEDVDWKSESGEVFTFDVYTDSDEDGVLDKDDDCPATPGPIANKGCPEIEEEVVEILKTAFDNLEFESARDIIKDVSKPSLTELTEVLVKKPEWRLQIAGHTDAIGNDQNNLVLSKKRAEAVRDFMVEKGIDTSRLSVLYFGETNPIATNDTPEGRQKNRRVEMTIIFD